jgi:NAD(P)H-dependent flavin oxidoreductase YrpB (nitropropane dioxygenase family)
MSSGRTTSVGGGTLCQILEIRYPIILAGMGGASGPELAAAVSNAGGLGVLGAAMQEPEGLDEWIRRTKSLTSEPFGVDTLLPARVPEDLTEEQLRAAIPNGYLDGVADIREQFGLPADADLKPLFPALSKAFFDRQLEVVMDHRVPVYAAGLGDPARYVEEFHRRGTKVIGVVGNVRNASRVAEGGSDVIVAQGHDGGGHNSPVGTLALIPQVVDAVGGRAAVVAAGGIGDGRGIVAAMALGASGVWMGTRFLGTEEANIPDGQKKQLLEASDQDTMVTRFVTGKPVRMLRSGLPPAFESRGLPPLPFPQMGLVSGPLLGGAERVGRYDLSPGAAGQVAGMINSIQPAGEVVAQLVREAAEALERLGGTTL